MFTPPAHPVQQAPRYAFGDFVLEPQQQRLSRRDGSALPLTPRPFSALVLLVERAGQLVDRDTLIEAVWPGVVVDDNSLSQVISALRRTLADDSVGSRYIQTVPRRGFRFIAAVTLLPAPVDTAPIGADAAQRIAPPAVPLSTSASTVLPVSAPRRRWLHGALAGAGLGLGGTALWWWQRAPSPTPGPPASTLAVLPFKPLAADARDELLALGMADSLIAQLSTVPGLAVRSIASVRRYAGSEQDALAVARALDVAWIVDGSLQRHGERLRVTARLLRASDGSSAWSGRFDEQATSVFDMQDSISARVAQVLASTLTVGVGRLTPSAHPGGTRNPDAYQLYLAAGRQAQDMRADTLGRSIALYNQALEIDPAYALAWVGLAEAHRRLLFGADAVPSEVFDAAGLAVGRALAVAPELAEAHTEQAFKRYWFDYDWAAAEHGFRSALALNPNVVMARFGLASLLLNEGRVEEGLAQMRTARELDPMSPVLNALESAYLLKAGQQEAGALRLQRAFDIAPNFWLPHATRAVLLHQPSDPQQAVAGLQQAVALAGPNTRPAALLATCLAELGRPTEARRVLDGLLLLARQRYVPALSLAAAHAALGEVGPALAALERAHAARDPRLTLMKDDWGLLPLHREPRYQALLQRMKLDRFGRGLAPL